jgi:bud emergence protein 1
MNTQHSSSSTATTNTSAGSHLKIKVWFEGDECIIIRMPLSVNFAELYKKVKERRLLQHPDEPDQELAVHYLNEGQNPKEWDPIRDDEELDFAIQTIQSTKNSGLQLSVTPRDGQEYDD